MSLKEILKVVKEVAQDIVTLNLPVTASAAVGTILVAVPQVHVPAQVIISAVTGVGVVAAYVNKLLTKAKPVEPPKVAV